MDLDREQGSVQRRTFIKRAAHAAWAAPFIVTVIASPANATHMGLANGAQCGTEIADCVPGSELCTSHNCTFPGTGVVCTCAA